MDRSAWLREALEGEPSLANQSSLAAMERHESDAWLSDCERWLLTNCVAEIRGCQSVGSLHVAFCEWAVSNHSVPCRRDVFEQLLDRIGVACVDGFAQSLMLARDLRLLKDSVTQ
jgi:hypothetical protein